MLTCDLEARPSTLNPRFANYTSTWIANATPVLAVHLSPRPVPSSVIAALRELIRSGLLHMVDDKDLNCSPPRNELEAELLLQCTENVRQLG
jgi:hypothetical protein